MNEKNELGIGINGGDTASSDPAITRKEFISKVLKGAAITGGVMLAPKVLDKFLVPPAFAAGSSCVISDTGGATKGDTATHTGSGDVFSFKTADTLCSGGS